ncbi:MAG: 1-acyl-sn-glycerol-3-phosphate acyltransferase [Bacteroidales bacterium]|nr:1-acyl-sn-glycerol-3-phosphate acyltransferase [Bacteroidales bacterium]
MKKTGLIIYSSLLWTFFLISSIVHLAIALLVWIITRWFDKRLIVLHLWSCFWGSWYIWFNPLWRVRVAGRRKIPWRRPCILVSNHQSMLDILVLYHLFVPYKWVSKKENFSIPIVGWNMRLNDYLEIERGHKNSLIKFMQKAGQIIRQGNSILMFPEGTRYPGGSLGPFKEGAFKLALDHHVDIIPILLDGTAKALPKKGAILTGFANIRVRVLDAIPYSTFAGKSPRELLIQVREMMSEEYATFNPAG